MNEYYNRFPSVLKKALSEKRVSFPDSLIKEYAPMLVYRGIRFHKGVKENVEKSDFLSQAERELPSTNYDDIYEYSCSCFEDVEELLVAYHLPRKNKGIAKGTIKSEGGPIVKDEDLTHINWFLYENIDPSNDFEVYNYEKVDRDK